MKLLSKSEKDNLVKEVDQLKKFSPLSTICRAVMNSDDGVDITILQAGGGLIDKTVIRGIGMSASRVICNFVGGQCILLHDLTDFISDFILA